MVFGSAITQNKSLGPTQGWRTHLEGTWDAASVTTGTINLSAIISRIERGAAYCQTGTGLTRYGLNVDGTNTAALGRIGIIACTSNDTGGWWAEGPQV